jgi:hypothetical protein
MRTMTRHTRWPKRRLLVNETIDCPIVGRGLVAESVNPFGPKVIAGDIRLIKDVFGHG